MIDTLELNPEATQGSPDWFQMRLGYASASRFRDVVAKIGKGEAASRRHYRGELVAERLKQQIVERYQNKAMAWGSDTEDLARLQYELETGNTVRQTGFLRHDTLMIGASPDGLIGDEGGLEIKCPEISTHITTLRGEAMPNDYYAQVQGGMAITDRKWWDFVSFVPELEGDAQMFIDRIPRDDDYIDNFLMPELQQFLTELDMELEFVKSWKRSKVGKVKTKPLK